MDFEFDKEIDALLRQAAQGETGLSNNLSAHLDADELSLFAENALPQTARVRATEHLADCLRCRRILSNFITLNADAKSENVHADEKLNVVSPVSIPWYRKLFVFPNVAYTMGALALLFSGLLVVMFFNNAGETQNSSVARMENVEEVPRGAGGASSDGETASKEVYSMSNSTASANSNMSVASNATTVNTSTVAQNKPLASATIADSSASVLQNNDKSGSEYKSNLSTVAPPPSTATTQDQLLTAKKENSPAPKPNSADESRSDNELIITQRQQSELPLQQQSTTVQNQAEITPDSRNVKRSAPMNARSVPRKDSSADSAIITGDAASGASEKSRAKSSESTRTVGGKTFKRADGVWYDSAYNQQKPINVRRGTDDYKKLDSGLRSIADNLGDTIVVVWKGKAYRIQ